MLMARPWMKFYPVDWRADPRLRMCSLAARGLWIDLMTYMHEGEPYGHLTIDGVPPPTNGIAALVGRPVNEVGKALAELEARGVFDRAENGAIVSRRMVRDKERSDEGREQVAKRWGHGSPGRDPNRSADRGDGGEPITQRLEARVQSPEKKENARASGARYSAEFEEKFWKPYPRTPTMSKLEAWKAWEKSPDDHAAIVAAVPRYAAWLRSKPDHPIVHACRFITQRRFDGFGSPEAPTRPAGTFYAKPESAELAAWDLWSKRTRGGKRMLRDRGGGWWVDSQWPPGDPRSVTPLNTAANQPAARAVERPAAAKNGGEDEVCTQTPRAAADA
jgi:hypothetical protein